MSIKWFALFKYLLLLVIVIVLNFLTASYGMFIMLLVIALSPLISLLYTLVLFFCVRLNAGTDKNIAVYNEPYEIRVTNKAPVPAEGIVLLTECRYNNLDKQYTGCVELQARRKVRECVASGVVLCHAGTADINLEKSYISDPLQIFRIRLRGDRRSRIVVLPALNEPDYYTLNALGGGAADSQQYSPVQSGYDVSEIFDVREYKDNDAINHIHWGLSARMDHLYVKEYSLPIYSISHIIVELTAPQDEQARQRLDAIFELTYAIGNIACIKEKDYSILFYSDIMQSLQDIPIRSMDDLYDAVLILMEQTGYLESRAFSEYLNRNPYNEGTLYYIGDTVPKDAAAMLENDTGQQVMAFIVDNGEHENESHIMPGGMLVYADADNTKNSLYHVVL